MNYENEIYKINDNVYIINWFNFLKIEYDINLSEETNFITNYKRNHYEYINNEDVDKYNLNDLIYDKQVNKYKMYEERENIFPYPLLSIDYTDELLYKNENNEWFLLKYASFDTNYAMRCQQGKYKEYKIELSNDENYDLVIKRNELEPPKYKNIYDEHYESFDTEKTKFEKVELDKDYEDPILNILFK